jgi:hypothetical protein
MENKTPGYRIPSFLPLSLRSKDEKLKPPATQVAMISVYFQQSERSNNYVPKYFEKNSLLDTSFS